MNAGMPQLDFSWYPSQLFWLFVVFTLFYIVMARLVIPRIHHVLENRQQRLEYDLDRAASLKAEAEEARDIYERAINDARQQAQAMLGEVSEAIRKTSDEKNHELDAILSSKVRESEAEIDAAVITANRDLEPTAAAITAAIIHKMTGTSPSEKECLAAVSKYNLSSAGA